MWLWSYLPMTFCCLTSVKTWWVGISLFSIFLNTTKVHSFFFYSQLPILLHCLCSKEIFTAATLSCCSNSPFTKRHTNQQFAVKSFWVIVIEVTHTYRYYHYISNFSLKKKKKPNESIFQMYIQSRLNSSRERVSIHGMMPCMLSAGMQETWAEQTLRSTMFP